MFVFKRVSVGVSTRRLDDILEICSEQYKNQLPVKRKEMFYLTTHSTHFIYGYMASVTS